LWICAVLVMSEHPENTGLISQRKPYSKNPIPRACAPRAAEEFLPGEGKIFTVPALRCEECVWHLPFFVRVSVEASATNRERTQVSGRRRPAFPARAGAGVAVEVCCAGNG
jgi:hypothetical protein